MLIKKWLFSVAFIKIKEDANYDYDKTKPE